MSVTSKESTARENDTKKSTVFTLDNFNSTTKLSDAMFTPPLGSTNTISEKDELYNPFDERAPEHPNSDAGALIHLLKSSLGTGILAMPMAFKNGGLVFGTIGTLLVGFLCTHCVHILVKSSHDLCKRTKTPSLGFSETAEAAFLNGPSNLTKLSGFARSFVNFALVITYFSGNCVYVSFIAKSIKEVVDSYYLDNLTEPAYIFTLLIILIPISQIRELKYLVPFSGIANLFIVISLCITLYYIFIDVPPLDDVPLFSSYKNLPMFFSTVIFAMEGIGVIMPVENSMRKPEHFLGCPGILNTAMGIVVGLYTIMGFFGYLRFGSGVKGSITMNLPVKEILAQVAKILIAVAITLTYALQFFVPMQITWNATSKCVPPKFQNVSQIALRTVIVICTAIVAAVVSNLESLIGLVGAICFSILGIFTPAVIETVTYWDHDLGPGNWKLYKNIFLMIFAIMALISGATYSIENLINPPPPY